MRSAPLQPASPRTRGRASRTCAGLPETPSLLSNDVSVPVELFEDDVFKLGVGGHLQAVLLGSFYRLPVKDDVLPADRMLLTWRKQDGGLAKVLGMKRPSSLPYLVVSLGSSSETPRLFKRIIFGREGRVNSITRSQTAASQRGTGRALERGYDARAGTRTNLTNTPNRPSQTGRSIQLNAAWSARCTGMAIQYRSNHCMMRNHTAITLKSGTNRFDARGSRMMNGGDKVQDQQRRTMPLPAVLQAVAVEDRSPRAVRRTR